MSGRRPYDLLGVALDTAMRHADLLEAHGLAPPTIERRLRVIDGAVSPLNVTIGPGAALGRIYDPLEGLLGILPIDRGSGVYWEPDPGGGYAVIQPVSLTGWPGERELIDLLAWNPLRPDRVRVLTGLAKWLGCTEQLGDGSEEEQPLVVVGTPMAWLRRPEALCVIDWSHAVLRELTQISRKLVFPDLALAELFRSRVIEALVPEILVEQSEAA